MINFNLIKSFFPNYLVSSPLFQKYILKEYIQLMILDYLSSTSWIRKITFIGGTNIRLTKGIDRFSEDLDFDSKDFSETEFMEMTTGILHYLQNQGINTEPKDRENPKLKAFRRNIHFPELLFELGLSGHRDERFLIKIENQDQQIPYKNEISNIKGCGYYFPMPVPPDDVLCSMKIGAMLDRQKGRDFYDVMFLLSQTKPNYEFLTKRFGIQNLETLKLKASEIINATDLTLKQRDFEHLLFNKKNSSRILHVADFFQEL